MVKASDISFNEGLIRLCALHGHAVEFLYMKPGGPSRYRTIIPTSITDKVVYGKDCDDSDQPKAFRLDRIQGEVFTP